MKDRLCLVGSHCYEFASQLLGAFSLAAKEKVPTSQKQVVKNRSQGKEREQRSEWG